MARIRVVEVTDAEVLADLVSRNREHNSVGGPLRPPEYYTVEGQRKVIVAALAGHGAGTTAPMVVVSDGGDVIGRITISDIVHGAAESGHVGYWIDAEHSGRGLMTEALVEVKQLAFTSWGLHRLQAATLLDNTRSQRVLAKAGFEPIGMAPSYLKINGTWQDHLLFQTLSTDIWPSSPQRVPDVEDHRTPPPPLGSDRASLEAWLDFYRETVPLKVAGLTPRQMCTRSVPRSTLTLAGLVRHLTFVERYWFANVVAGEDLPLLHGEVDPDGDFNGASPDTALADLQAYLSELEESRRRCASVEDLDTPVAGQRRGQPVNLRWVLTHLIEEYARHLGHADLLREALDGRTGY